MRKPDEIKRGLDVCSCLDSICDEVCPYAAIKFPNCRQSLLLDAFQLIDQAKIAQPKWISVEERLPEEIKREDVEGSSSDLVIVVVCDDMNNMFVSDDILCEGKWANYPAPLFEVTHWLPLPEPPKEDE